MEQLLRAGMLSAAISAILIGCAPQDAGDDHQDMGGMDSMMMADSAGRRSMMRSMMRDPEMTRLMMRDREMMRSMMDAMSRDTTAMRQLMADSNMMQSMSRHMAEHPDLMRRHMEAMMTDAEHRRAMTEAFRQSPSLREQMARIIEDAAPR